MPSRRKEKGGALCRMALPQPSRGFAASEIGVFMAQFPGLVRWRSWLRFFPDQVPFGASQRVK